MKYLSMKGGVEITPFWVKDVHRRRLTAETVQGTALPLQCVHHIESSDCLAASVLCVSDCIPDYVFQEHLCEPNSYNSAEAS